MKSTKLLGGLLVAGIAGAAISGSASAMGGAMICSTEENFGEYGAFTVSYNKYDASDYSSEMTVAGNALKVSFEDDALTSYERMGEYNEEYDFEDAQRYAELFGVDGYLNKLARDFEKKDGACKLVGGGSVEDSGVAFGYTVSGNLMGEDWGVLLDKIGEGLGAFILLTIICAIISVVVSHLINMVLTWGVYKKAGYRGWEGLIPFYNTYCLCKIADVHMAFFIVSIFVPAVNIYTYAQLAKKFGQGEEFGLGLFFLNVVFFPILGYSKKIQYQGKKK